MESPIKLDESPAYNDYPAFFDEKGSLLIKNPFDQKEFVNLTPLMEMINSMECQNGYSPTPIGLSERVADAVEGIMIAYETKGELGEVQVRLFEQIFFLMRFTRMLARMSGVNQKAVRFEGIELPTLKKTA